MAFKAQRQRLLLWCFIASISLCALTGIYCLLLGTWGDLQEHILVSTGLIAAASILALVATIPWGRRIWHPIGPAGCAAAAAGLVLGLIGIWSQADTSELFNKTVVISWVLGVSIPLVGLLALSRLSLAYAWVKIATVLVITLLTLQLIATIIVEPDIDWWARVMGVIAILSASGIIAVPILRRLSGIPDIPHAAELSNRLAVTCPRCGLAQKLPLGRSTCAECGLQFQIQVGQ